MAVKPKKHAASSLSITPLIDVVFLLLIFFLVTSRFAEEEREIKLQLPSASESLPLTAEPKELVVNVDKDGKYFVDGKYRHVENLQQLLVQAAANNPLNQKVVIRADKTADWEYVLRVIDLCKAADIEDYTAVTDE